MDATIALMLIEALLIFLDIAIFKFIRFISPSLDVINCSAAVDYNSCQENIVSMSMVSSRFANVTVAPPPTKYDVFISFRGQDTRENFSSYLYRALYNAGIRTFMDHKLQKGEHISSILLRTIEESEISMIVFSDDYASSSWCMDELIQILECMDKYGRIVIPIFYNVDPSSVRKQDGNFGNGFAKLKQRFKDNQGKVQKWRNALIRSASLCGWDSMKIRPEFELIDKIVADILSKLDNCQSSSCHFEGLVGIDDHIEKIVEFLHEVRIVGIWGMGGIGKTTLAKAVFHQLKEKFEAFSFAKNVREQLARIGLDGLKEKCLRELLKDEAISIYNMESSLVKRRLKQKKILLVLDDVDNLMTVHVLKEVCGWLGEGSRIIITSRDKQVLDNASASRIYQVPALDPDHALRLFSLKAFKQNEPHGHYMRLSKKVVNYCHGNPLALVVLGCFLHGRGKEDWKTALRRLKQDLLPEVIFNVLKLSFDGLNADELKLVFLYLAFSIKQPDRLISPDTELYSSLNSEIISVLNEKSLILVDEFGNIKMHRLFRRMAIKIVRNQSSFGPQDPAPQRIQEGLLRFMALPMGRWLECVGNLEQGVLVNAALLESAALKLDQNSADINDQNSADINDLNSVSTYQVNVFFNVTFSFNNPDIKPD